MKKLFYLLLIPIFGIMSCSSEDNGLSDNLPDIDNKITAKENTDAVLTSAKAGFSPDAELAVVYGMNVSVDGTVDLTKPTENLFLYIVQSDTKQSNDFYTVTVGETVIKSPLNLQTIIEAIDDTASADLIQAVVNALSSNSLPDNNWVDSPTLISIAQANGGTAFFAQHPDAKIDILLVPFIEGIIPLPFPITLKYLWLVNYTSSNSNTNLLLLFEGGSGIFLDNLSD